MSRGYLLKYIDNTYYPIFHLLDAVIERSVLTRPDVNQHQCFIMPLNPESRFYLDIL